MSKAWYEANKEKVAAYAAKYYAEHRNEILAQKAKWRAENKAEAAAQDAKSYATHKDKDAYKAAKKIYLAGWRAEHKAEAAAYAAEYFAAHKDFLSAKHAEYHNSHPDKIQAARSRRRARKMGVESDNSVLSDVIALYGNRCLCCGAETALTVDHVIPLARGGSDLLDNKQPLCKSCNSSKGVKTVDYRITIRGEGLWAY